MRHRLDPVTRTSHREDDLRNRHGRDKEVAQPQLKSVIRLQNQVILGLSSCFVLVIISTLVLVQHLPHPNDDRRPFWEANQIVSHPQITEVLLKQVEPKPQIIANCSSYGCPLRPVELSSLTYTPPSSIASKNHIILTHKSNRQKPAPINQDRAVLIPSFCNECQSINITSRGQFFVGIFDGHDDNGHLTAQFASDEIPSRIGTKIPNTLFSSELGKSDPDEVEVMKQMITKAFVEVDADVPESGGGCIASIIFRRGSKLYMANTGDSTSFIVVYRPPSDFDEETAKTNGKYIYSPRSPDVQLHLQGSISIHHQNKKHKPNFPEERSRIESLGGRVHIPPKSPMGSRVIVRSALHREDVGLAMSRSIGDWEWTAVGVIPDPDVTVLDLRTFWSENDIRSGAKVFVVMGSDGLFDARRAEFVAAHLAFGFFESQSAQQSREPDSKPKSFASHMIDVGKKLINMASPMQEKFYRDDISFVAQVVEL
ncbi:hypothetical protein ACHAWF_003980 [Thalassiosira exigua]